MKLRWHLPAEDELVDQIGTAVTRYALNTEEAKHVLQKILDMQYINSLVFPDESSPRRKDFLELLRGLIRAGLDVWFITDGQGLSDSYLRDLIEAGPFAVSISFYAATPEADDSVCGDWSYAAALNALRIFSNYKQHLHSPTLLQTVFRLTSWNQQEAEDFLELNSHLKVDTCCFLTPPSLNKGDDGGRRDTLAPEELLTVCDRLAAYTCEYQLTLVLPVPPAVIDSYRKSFNYPRFHTGLEYRCSSGLHTVSITSKGLLTPCEVALHSPSGFVAGHESQLNLFKRDLRSIYFSQNFSQFIQAANDPEHARTLPHICRECRFWLKRECQPTCFVSPFRSHAAAAICEAALRTRPLELAGEQL